jgi:hypothetical protein
VTRLRYGGTLVVGAIATSVLAAAPVERPARTIERDGVAVAFPAVAYGPPAPSDDPVAVVCARMATAAIGARVDPVRDRIAETEHRVIFRDPTDPAYLLKVYRPDRYPPEYVAKLLQRDLAVQALLAGLGLRVAAIDPAPRLLERGVERQRFVVGKGLDDLYPHGYQAGTNAAVDHMLDRIAAVDRPLRTIVSMQTGLLFTNTVDCHTDRPLGVDLGHCYANIFLETGSGEPIFVDW